MSPHHAEHYERYQKMRLMLSFGEPDRARLQELRPLLDQHGEALTDSFYAVLLAEPETRAMLGDRVPHLRTTHRRWLLGLCEGSYGRAFFEAQFRIGTVHVEQGIPPWFVSVVMNIVRVQGRGLICAHFGPQDSGAHVDSFLRVLDLAAQIIEMGYIERRLQRLAKVTCMSRQMILEMVEGNGADHPSRGFL